jgi:hypothetical protein
MLVMAVVAEFMLNEQNQHHAASHAERQAGNVDERVGFVL